MKYFCLCSALGFWLCVAIQDFYMGSFFALCYAVFLVIRFQRKLIVLLWILLTLGMLVFLNRPISSPTPGEYTVYEIKPNYVLARKENTSIVLYGIEEPEYYSIYRVKEFEEISPIENIGQFSFKTYLSKQDIFYSADVSDKDYIDTIPSIRNNVFKWMSKLKEAPYYLANYYGIREEDVSTILISLGLSILGAIQILRNIILRFYSKEITEIILFCVCVLYGGLFTFTISLIRIIVFILGRILFSKWEYAMSFSVYLFLILLPKQAMEFVFVLPVCIMIIVRFCHDLFKRILLIRLVLFLCQIWVFHQVDLVVFLMFGLLRKIHSFIFLISGIALVLPIPFDFILICYDMLIQWVPSIVVSYLPNFLFMFVGVCLVYRIYNHKRILFLSCIFLTMLFFGRYIDPFFHVYVLDIGQGDCTLIVEPFMKSVVMIDCGQNLYRDNVEKIIYPILKEYNISKLSAVIITHEDFDHSGGLEKLSGLIEIEKVITDSTQKIPVDYPFYSLLEKRQSKDENDRSIISYFSYDDLTYLWTGDAGVDVEQQLIETYELDVDILKLGHHGSSTSSSYSFLDALRPTLGLVSVGQNNRYGHPDSSVIANCNDLGIDLLMTKDVGMIHIFSFKGLSFFTTASGLFGIIGT